MQSRNASTTDTSVRVYRYGLLPPILGADRVDEQIHLAHRYQNRLVGLERDRRERVRVIMRAHLAEELIAEESALAAETSRLSGLLRQTPAVERAPLREALKAQRAQLRAVRERIREAKTLLRDDAAAQAEIAEVNAAARTASRRARAECGVYWGTYLLIEEAMDAARRGKMDPRFRRWTGDGAVGVQLQGGLTASDALAATDTRLRLDPNGRAVPGRGGKPLPRLYLRVGSDGRAPIWAEWPLIYHRALPDEARIKWAKVVRSRVAGRYRWSAHITVELPSPPTTKRPGAVAVDLGWRRQGDSLRSGAWSGTDGTGAEITLSPAIRGALKKADSLRAIRDRHVNELRLLLIEWRGENVSAGHPASEAMRNLGQWRAAGRFARLALWWRAHRFEGDAFARASYLRPAAASAAAPRTHPHSNAFARASYLRRSILDIELPTVVGTAMPSRGLRTCDGLMYPRATPSRHTAEPARGLRTCDWFPP